MMGLGEDPLGARVLVVGAGGIGCELLKNLVLSRFTNIEVVDLDVIELSNLNRQFLFRREHIGQPKAKVAVEAVKRLAPNLNITAHFANIKDTGLFPLRFFRNFDLILNALDNLDARRYVNEMCLTAGVSLVESGTAGYLGQTSVILQGKSECFDCTPKESPKTFAVCTIRTTPSAPIHCIVWAKELLLANLFGMPTEEGNLPDDVDGAIVESLKRESDAFIMLREMAVRGDVEYVQAVFNKVFNDDIKNLLALEELWESRNPPTPLTMDLSQLSDKDFHPISQHEIWDLQTWIALFKMCTERLRRRAFDDHPFCEIFFDKDDEDVMNLVSAAANIRAFIFGIPMINHFAVKSMAGNIIPAIATTNAIVAGMIVMQALNILASRVDDCCTAFITYGQRRGALFALEKMSPPNPQCAVCQVDRVIVRVDPLNCTLGRMLDQILVLYSQALKITVRKEDSTVLEGSRILYDEDMTVNEEKTLASLGCGESKFIKVDFLDSCIPLVIVVEVMDDKGIECKFTLLPQSARHPLVETQPEKDDIVEPQAKKSRIELPTAPTVIAVEDDIIIL
jgi:ubiquitin-like 1-activating enzyme E1 B